MKRIVILIIILICSSACFSQISDGQDNLLQTAFKKRDTILLSKFIEKWKSDTRYDKNQITDDTISCLYAIFKDMLVDTDARVKNLFTSNKDLNKYSIIPSQIRYAVIHELDPDSVISHQVLRSTMADTSKQKLLAAYSRDNDMLFENLYNVYLPDSLFKTLQHFYPDNTQFLYSNKFYDEVLAKFLSPEYNERRISFLKTFMIFPKKIYKETDQYNARLSKVDGLEILIDDKQEWAILCRNWDFNEAFTETLFHKKNGKWQYYRWITTIVD
jgi:hypothetical protein